MPSCFSRALQLICLVLSLALSTIARAEPPYDDFLVIPLRVHILSSKVLPELDCGLTDQDIHRILGKVNGVWHQAGVHWGLESIVREPAAEEERFKLARDQNGGAPLGLFRIIRPTKTSTYPGIHVYYIHEFPVNGVHMGGDFVMVQETAKLRPVEGGIDEPIPRVSAHELGHVLGLSHRQDRTNLLASGTTGTLLNEAEVKKARARAEKTAGVATVVELEKNAEIAETGKRIEDARRLWTWLAELPGEKANQAKAKLKKLDDPPNESPLPTAPASPPCQPKH